MVGNMQDIQEQLFETATPDQFQILLESRIDYIKNANKDKISASHDPESAKFSSDKIVDQISKIDPTTRKSHTEWLVNRYKQGEFKLSDAKEVKKHLSNFEQAASVLPNSDIKSYKSLSDLKDAVATTTVRRKLNAPVDAQEETGLEEQYHNDGVHGFQIKDQKTSTRLYGPNGKLARCKWCTSAEGDRNMFGGYQGGKYTMHFPNGRVLQFNHSSGQVMDEQNAPANIDTNPAYSPYKTDIKKFITETGKNEKQSQLTEIHKHIAPEEVDSAIQHYKTGMQEHAEASKEGGYVPYDLNRKINKSFDNLRDITTKADINDKQFQDLNHLPSWNSWTDKYQEQGFKPYLAANRSLKTEHLNELADTQISKGTDAHEMMLSDIATHPNTSSETLHKLVGFSQQHEGYSGLHEALKNDSPNMKEEHFDRMNLSTEDKVNVFQRSPDRNVPEKWFAELKDTHPSAIARHVQLPEAIAKEIVESHTNNPHRHHAAENLLENPSVAPELKHQVIEKHNIPLEPRGGVATLINQEGATHEDISKYIKAFNENKLESNDKSWVSSNRLSRDDIHALINGPHIKSFQSQILENPKIRAPELETIASHPQFNEYATARILQNPHLKSNTVSTILNAADTKIPSEKNYIQRAVIDSKSPAIKPEHIGRILDNPDIAHDSKIEALKHPANAPEHFQKFMDSPRMHGAISISENAPPSILHKLATSPMHHVRLNVANNPNASPETLNILKTDSQPEIAEAAAKRRK